MIDSVEQVNFLQEFVGAGNCYEKYRLQSMRRQVDVFNRRGYSTMDVEFKNQGNETRLIRVQSYGPDKEGEVELTFGGGGNMTTFEEMKYILEKTADKILSTTTN